MYNENNMTRVTLSLTQDLEGLIGVLMSKYASDIGAFSSVNEDELLILARTFNLIKRAMELMKTQAEVLDDINNKLDILLEK